MKRQILRFPVGPQFRKILEDDHEWKVITDLRLKPLVMRRGNIGSVSSKTIIETYEELKKSIPFEKTIKIYSLNSCQKPNIQK